MTDGLKEAHREAIIAAIAANDRVERAVLFGSRATGTNTVTSDVDIALFGDRLTLTDNAQLATAIDEIPMAQSVDLLLYDSIRDRVLRDHIQNDGVEWFAHPSHVASDPEEWPQLCFKELLGLPVRNGIYKRKEYRGHGMKIVNMGELFAHPRLGAVPMKRVSLSESEKERFSVVEGDLLFARRSLVAEGAGRCCVVLSVDEPTTFESSIIRARPDPTRSDSLFLYYFFNSPLGMHLLDTIRRQVAVAGITGKDLSELAIPVPSVPEQRAIASILGTLDDKIELNRRMNETLEAMARALFKSWFVDFDPVRAKMEGHDTSLPRDIAVLFPDRLVDSAMGEIPEGWQVTTLAECIEVNPRRSLRKGQTAPYLPMAKMPTHGHMPDSVAARPFGSGMRFVNGDTLVARITPCLENGKTAYVDFLTDEEIGWGSTEYIVLRPKPPLPNQFAYCLARSARFREFAIQNMSGTSGRQRVPPAALRGFLIVVPPRRLAAGFGEVAGSLFERASKAGHESRTLAALRDALLPKLISGEARLRRSR